MGSLVHDIASLAVAERLYGTRSWKAPVKTATNANITLAGTQTVNGVALAIGDEVLVKDQNIGANNGIYVVQSGAWMRRSDWTVFDSNVAFGTQVFDATHGIMYSVTTETKPIVVGTTAVAFQPLRVLGNVAALIESAVDDALEPIQEAVDDLDDIAAKTNFLTVTASTNLDTMRAKLAFLTVTQNIDLDAWVAIIAGLAGALVNKGGWSAAGGTFPGSGAAKSGWAYMVTADGTVDGQSFNAGDMLYAIANNASTSTYAGNWFKVDNTDRVASVAGLSGAITASALKAALSIAVADIVGLSANVTTLLGAADFAAFKTSLSLNNVLNVAQQAASAIAAAADIRGFTENTKHITSAAMLAALAPVTLTYGATYTADLTTFLVAEITLTGGVTFANPSAGMQPGRWFEIYVIQDATGSRTIAFGSQWKCAGGTPSASTGANKVDVIAGRVISSTLIRYSYAKDFS